MSRVLDEDLVYEILSVVEEIPEGNVATYGQIARLIGRPKNSRLVGKVLSMVAVLRRLSLSQSGKPRRKTRPGLGYAKGAACRRGR